MHFCISSFRWGRWIFLGLWGMMLTLPLVLKVTGSVLGFPKFKPFLQTENREPHGFVNVREVPMREWGRGMDAWYADNFAFRTDIVEGYRRFLYEVLRTPVGSEVPGKGDWVFWRGGTKGNDSWAELDDYLGAFELTPEELECWRTFFEGRVEWARAHGAVYLELITSVKAMIHVEQLPTMVRAHRGQSVAEQIQAELRGSFAEKNVLFLGDALREAVATGRDVYYEGDHHPAPYGMWVQFDVLNRRIREDFPEVGEMPYYDEGAVPEAVLGGMEVGCYPDAGRRLAVSNPGTRQVYDWKVVSTRKYPYTNVSTVNEAGGISLLVFHDSFLRFSLASWKGQDGDVRFPFAPGIGRVDARIFARFTTMALTDLITERVPEVILEQFPECRLTKDLVSYDETMRRAAGYGRASEVEVAGADEVRVLAVLEGVRGEGTVRVKLWRGERCCGEEEVLPGVRRAIFFAPLRGVEGMRVNELRVEVEGGECEGIRVEMRE